MYHTQEKLDRMREETFVCVYDDADKFITSMPVADVPEAEPDRGERWRGQFTTAAALILAWQERDTLYTGRLTDEQVAIIRNNRKAECSDLPPGERATAWIVAATWVPREA